MRMTMNAWFRRGAGLVLVSVCLAMTAAVAAQETAATTDPTFRDLRSRVEQRFQVVTLRRGIVLVPKETQPSFSNIEVNDDGGVLVDGAPVTGRELRARVAGDADVIAQVSFLTAAQRREVFAKVEPARPATETPTRATEDPPATTAPATPAPRPDDEWVERERSRRGGARVRVGGDVWVKEDEAVGDAVVAIFGTATVDGRVDGDVVAVGGNVKLGPRADVRGNVVAVGGTVERQSGARVQGDLDEIQVGFPSFGPWVRFRPWQNWHWLDGGFGASTDLFASLLRMAVLALFTLMIVAAATSPVRRVAHVVVTEPWRAGLAGLAAQIFFVPLLVITVVILAVSIVGIPLLLLVPFGLLAAVFALFLGFAGATCAVGESITRRVGSGTSRLTLLATCVVGLAVIWALTAVARFAGLAGPPLRVVLGVVLLAGFVIEYAAWTVGLGAVLLTRFGRRGSQLPASPPPPLFDGDDGSVVGV